MQALIQLMGLKCFQFGAHGPLTDHQRMVTDVRLEWPPCYHEVEAAHTSQSSCKASESSAVSQRLHVALWYILGP